MFNHFYQNRLHNFVIKPQSKSSSYSRMIRPLFLKSFYLQWAFNSSVKPKKIRVILIRLTIIMSCSSSWEPKLRVDECQLDFNSAQTPPQANKQASTNSAPSTSSCWFTICHKKKKQRLRLCAAASASAEALEALEQGGSSRREVRQMAPTAPCLHVGVCIVPT